MRTLAILAMVAYTGAVGTHFVGEIREFKTTHDQVVAAAARIHAMNQMAVRPSSFTTASPSFLPTRSAVLNTVNN